MFFHLCCPNLTQKSEMRFSFFSGTYSNLCIPSWAVAVVPARFVLCSCRYVFIKAELTKLAWYKTLLEQGPNLDAFSNDTKEWWAQSATAGWLGVAEKLSSSLKHLLHSMSQIMPVAYNHTFNHSSSPEEDLPKAIKHLLFFFNLDIHLRYIWQNQKHIKSRDMPYKLRNVSGQQ